MRSSSSKWASTVVIDPAGGDLAGVTYSGGCDEALRAMSGFLAPAGRVRAALDPNARCVPLSGFAQAFLTVFPAELPDKTMVASIVLVARYRRPAAVWAGATLAFVVHVTVAVLAGRLLTLLPETPVQLLVAGLFAFGAVALVRAARATRREEAGGGPAVRTGFGAALAGSFALVIAAEWGDLTQLATASLAAGGGNPIAIGLGALLALSSVAVLAVTVGRQLVARVPLHIVNLVAAAVFAALAVATLVRLLR